MKHTVEILQLKGGSKFLLVNAPGASGFLMSTFVRGGTKYTPKDKFEIAHLLEHLAFNGTSQLPSKMEFAYEVEKDGAYTNATTSDNTINYIYESSIKEYKRIVDIACGQLSSPVFNQKDLESEKEVIKSELSRKLTTDRSRCGYNGVYLKLAKHSLPISKRIETLQNINLQDIKNYHKKYHVLKNLTIIVAGDFTTNSKKDLIDKLNNNLASMPVGLETPYKNTINLSAVKTISVQKPKFDGQTNMSFDLLQPKYDMSVDAAMRVLRIMYGVGEFSRLHDKARSAGLSYGVSVGYSLTKEISTFGFSDQTEDAKAFALYELCLRELNAILNGNFTQKEFDRAVGFIRGRFERSYDRAEELGYYYEDIFIDGDELIGPDEFVGLINKLKPADIVALNKTFVKKGSWILSLVGNNINKSAYKKVTEKYFG